MSQFATRIQRSNAVVQLLRQFWIAALCVAPTFAYGGEDISNDSTALQWGSLTGRIVFDALAQPSSRNIVVGKDTNNRGEMSGDISNNQLLVGEVTPLFEKQSQRLVVREARK